MTPFNRIAVLLLASLTAPVQAAVYKCQQGTQTVYSDVPCPSAKIVDTTNGKAPELADQYRAQARGFREKAKIYETEYKSLREKRERLECQEMAGRHNVTMENAAKYQRDPWWVNRAGSSAAHLNERCGKYLVPQGAR